MIDNNYSKVFALKGGWNMWKEKGFPVEKK
jgi:3-mercaptopyruvate sulfurtransferase SseA